MATITVKNLGQVKIKGNVPNEEEKQKIISILKNKKIEQKSPYGNIVDDMEVPEGNARTEAIEDYLTSPAFGRLALEIGGGVAGARTGGTL